MKTLTEITLSGFHCSLKMIKFEILKPVNNRVEYASQQLLSGLLKVSKTQGKWLLDRISVD
jgi:hypothetical protein